MPAFERRDQAPHVRENREYWNSRATDWVAAGERAWAAAEPTWGIWGVPEADLRLLPTDMRGMRAVELGCGTGYVSSWMARRGANTVGIDVSEEQLATARRLRAQYDAPIEFVLGDAERTPFDDATFDFAISEYGAAIWCDPLVWVAEAHRILKPGGRLRFLGTHPLMPVCSPLDGSPVTRELVRTYFGSHAVDWRSVEVDPGGIEFNLPIEGWVGLFSRVGFVIEGYREPRPAQASGEERFSVSDDWARNWPSEQVWYLRKA